MTDAAGRYRLISRLGAGGFGQVWRAYDNDLGVEVAIKQVLPRDANAPDSAERLARAAREARNAARLRDHPAIVSVYDVFIADGAPWIVMQLVDGVSLDEHVKECGPMMELHVAKLADALLGALAAAHAADIVHRDVKPANVLLTANGHPLLTDFGIAKHRHDHTLTSEGSFLGSPGYTAPERVRGEDAGSVGDLFSLGATLYEAVEGRPPFRKDIITSVVFDQPATPRRAGSLSGLILGLLEKDPRARLTIEQARTMLATPVTQDARLAQLTVRRAQALYEASVTQDARTPTRAYTGGADVVDVPVPSSFNVVITAAGAKKIQVIKVVRELTNLGLKEAKDLVDRTPSVVLTRVDGRAAARAEAALDRAGAVVEVVAADAVAVAVRGTATRRIRVKDASSNGKPLQVFVDGRSLGILRAGLIEKYAVDGAPHTLVVATMDRTVASDPVPIPAQSPGSTAEFEVHGTQRSLRLVRV